jgi:hypothetical protein
LNESEETDWYIPEFSPDKKNITCWITDSVVYKQDTLRIEMNYLRDDSLNVLVPKTDTLQLVARKKEAPKKDKNKKEETIEFLDIKITPAGTMDVFDTLKITFSEPILALDSNAIVFEHKVDTLWQRQDIPLRQDSMNPRIFYLEQRWSYGQEYQVGIDSAAIHSIYRKWNNTVNSKFKTQVEEEYGDLYVKVTGVEGSGFGQLLNGSDKLIRESLVEDGELAFEDMKPGKYYLRYIRDTNGNGKWDTGSYAEKQQPEAVYYFPAFFEIRKYGEIEHTWNVTETPVDKQKPLDITKNKPVVKKTKRDEQTTNQRNSTSATNRSSGQGMSGSGKPSLSRY